MNQEGTGVQPLARKENLVVHEVARETLIYDLNTHKAHCLNRSAAIIWGLCDGKSSVSGIALSLPNYELPASEEVVLLALAQLEKASLLQATPAGRGRAYSTTRRALLKRAAIVGAAGVLLPAVVSMVAPTAASAATCAPLGGTCSTVADCCPPATACSGICVQI